MRENDDDELMRRVREGDETAFAAIVDRHQNSLVNYLAQMCGNREQAEEVAQESFVRLYRTANRYRANGSVAPYLFRIATNHLRTLWRREKRWKILSFGIWQPDTDAHTPADDLIRDEETRQVRNALSRLPVTYRAALVMREIEGWSYQQIADALGCPEGTVKSKINRGRAQLRSELAAYWNGVEVAHEI